VFLGVVTQRPAELDPTIISQCSTIFAMRMSNDRDQALLRSAVSDVAANLLTFVPTLGTREVFAFGQGVAVPTRLKFSDLPESQIPRSEALRHSLGPIRRDVTSGFIENVIERWRGASMSHKPQVEDWVPREEAAPVESAPRRDSDRFKNLKKTADAVADAAAPARRQSFGQLNNAPADVFATPRKEAAGQAASAPADVLASPRKDSFVQVAKWRNS
jgi:hypothetical protein